MYSPYKLTKLFNKHCSCEVLITKDFVEALTEVKMYNYCVLTDLIWPTRDVLFHIMFFSADVDFLSCW